MAGPPSYPDTGITDQGSGPPPGRGQFCLYAAAALAAGFVLIGRRDA